MKLRNKKTGDIVDLYKFLIKDGWKWEDYEEAEKDVEKLKAWKQLKDDGITFTIDESNGTPFIAIGSKEETGTIQKVTRIVMNLTLLFGGEDE